jgi:MFS family permease
MIKIFENFIRLLKDLDRSVKVAIVGTGIMNWGQQLTSRYDPLYAKDLGADPINLGVLSSINTAFSAIIRIPMGWAIDKYGVKKVMLLGIALFVIHATIFALSWQWWILIPAYVISSRMAPMMPLSDVICVTATEPQKRATVTSLSRVLWALLGTFAPMTSAFIVTYFGGINAQGIRPLYFLQIFLSIFVFFWIYWKLPPTPDRVQKKDKLDSNWTSLVQSYREIFQSEKYVKRWMAIRSIRQFGSSLAMPFVSLWLVDVKGADPYIIGAISTVSLIPTLVLQTPAGWLADRIGRKKVFFLLTPFSYIGTLLLILAPSPEYLILAGLLGATALGGEAMGAGISGVSFPAFITMWWEVVPEEKRGRLFGMEGIIGLAAIPASILGGILWQQGFMKEVLFIPVLLEILLLIPILATTPETVRSKQNRVEVH